MLVRLFFLAKLVSLLALIIDDQYRPLIGRIFLPAEISIRILFLGEFSEDYSPAVRRQTSSRRNIKN